MFVIACPSSILRITRSNVSSTQESGVLQPRHSKNRSNFSSRVAYFFTASSRSDARQINSLSSASGLGVHFGFWEESGANSASDSASPSGCSSVGGNEEYSRSIRSQRTEQL